MLAPGQEPALTEQLSKFYPVEVWEVLDALDGDERQHLFGLLPPKMAAEVIHEAGVAEVRDLIEAISEDRMADLIEELAPDNAAEVLSDLPDAIAKQLIGLMETEKSERVQHLLAYPAETAGRMMNEQVLRVQLTMTVAQTIEFMRGVNPDTETFHHLYGVNARGKLLGIVRLRHLLTASPETVLTDLAEPEIVSVRVDQDQEDVALMMSKYNFSAIPVIDHSSRLVGVITHDDVIDILEEEATEDIQRLGGSMPLEAPYLSVRATTIARKRIGWLLLLFVTASLTGYLLHNFQDDPSFKVLALFIPLLIGTGGNAGSQTTSMVIRALAVGDIELREALQVLWHEMKAGALLGLLMALGGIGLALAMGVGLKIAMAVAISALLIVVWATSVGSVLPLIARALRIDPTLVSGPLMSTLVDATGLLIYFSIARYILGSG